MTNETEELNTVLEGQGPNPPVHVTDLPIGEALKSTDKPFDFGNPEIHPVLLSNSLVKFLYDWGGYNVHANHLGVDSRVIAVRGIDTALFNPRIVYMSDEEETLEEGSITHYGLVVKVPRPKNIRVRYEDAFGATKTSTFIDLTARAILNSIDGLDGVLFYNRANRYHRDQALRRWSKFKKNIRTK